MSGNLSGRVLYGVNNIYTIALAGNEDEGERKLLCRIKGKILKADDDPEQNYYNPIAVGDIVTVVPDSHSPDEGVITDRLERKNALIRWNRKKKLPQVLAANVDLLAALTSVQSPPFRPRFLDRLIITGLLDGIKPMIIANKNDLETSAGTEERLSVYESLGYSVFRCSVKERKGIDEIVSFIGGRTTVFAGQSGVGKSSLLNAIEPGFNLQVGDISLKHDRGAHTTNYAIMLSTGNGTRLIDTPGIRECWIHGLDSDQLRFHFPEFQEPARECAYTSCLHLNEPGCRVIEMVDAQEIHPDRYESYVRIYESLSEREGDY